MEILTKTIFRLPFLLLRADTLAPAASPNEMASRVGGRERQKRPSTGEKNPLSPPAKGLLAKTSKLRRVGGRDVTTPLKRGKKKRGRKRKRRDKNLAQEADEASLQKNLPPRKGSPCNRAANFPPKDLLFRRNWRR